MPLEPRGSHGGFLQRMLPEQRVYIKTGDEQTRYFVLTPLMQAALGIGAFAVSSWVVVATSALLLGVVSADNEANQAQVMQEAYEARIAALSLERDHRAQESSAVQARFQLALDEISDSQARLMSLQEERRELITGIALMRDKLRTAINSRDMAADARDALENELNTVTEDLSTRLGSETELAETLETITGALEDTVIQRDTSITELGELERRLAEMEYKERVSAERQDRIFSQLEDAVLVALDPLERLLETTGRDVDDLVRQVREQYSGEGGPLFPAAHVPGRADDPMVNRFATLMDKLDRAHLMQLAAMKLPFALPVRQSVRYTSGFGYRRDPITGRGRMHSGQDLAGPRNTPILASGDGTVVFAGRQSGYGNVIKIKHAFGYQTVYAHLHRMDVKTGDTVSRGDVIGGMGNTGRSTGTHLHYEIRIGGTPVNPMPYMKAAKDVF